MIGHGLFVTGEVLSEESLGGEYGDAGEFGEDEQVAIAGDDVIGSSGNGSAENDEVFWVAQFGDCDGSGGMQF